MGAHQPAWCASGQDAPAPVCGPSLDDPRFEALLLQLHAAIDVGGFWLALQSILKQIILRTAEQGEFTAGEIALLERLHPHIETTLQRLSALERGGVRRISPRRFAAANSECMQSCLTELTAAERELVRFVRAGWSNKEIAAKLNKSVRTVKTQLTSVYKKSGVRSRSRLLALMLGAPTA